MKKRKGITNAVLAACLSLFATCGFAQVVEQEPNDTIDKVQELTIGPGGPDGKGIVTVKGVIGNLEGPAVPDVDFYSFYGREGDIVVINIDDGMGGVRPVNTILGLFGPGLNRLAISTDTVADQKNIPMGFKDARIGPPQPPVRLPVDGTYIVGVSSNPRFFLLRCCNVMSPNDVNNAEANGDYTLIITGVTVPYIVINLEIKPGSDGDAPFNPKARGALPVALLGSSQFDVTTVNRDSLKFGKTGMEDSRLRCAKEAEDIDGDGYLDLVCHFDNQLTGFTKSDTTGVLTGTTTSRLQIGTASSGGLQIRGQGDLRVIPE